jgi:hypothetical protein
VHHPKFTSSSCRTPSRGYTVRPRLNDRVTLSLLYSLLVFSFDYLGSLVSRWFSLVKLNPSFTQLLFVVDAFLTHVQVLIVETEQDAVEVEVPKTEDLCYCCFIVISAALYSIVLDYRAGARLLNEIKWTTLLFYIPLQSFYRYRFEEVVT